MQGVGISYDPLPVSLNAASAQLFSYPLTKASDAAVGTHWLLVDYWDGWATSFANTSAPPDGDQIEIEYRVSWAQSGLQRRGVQFLAKQTCGVLAARNNPAQVDFIVNFTGEAALSLTLEDLGCDFGGACDSSLFVVDEAALEALISNEAIAILEYLPTFGTHTLNSATYATAAQTYAVLWLNSTVNPQAHNIKYTIGTADCSQTWLESAQTTDFFALAPTPVVKNN